ncbi:hypothetical protein L7H23_09565 [Sphingopyxis sp. BSN-002]|uniref:hypothetical protein n=1 Tax=Sphingopyxis sp. BSN-002 TaxID=2911495 RepID=UPI001EDBD101|nr:hypothetical protein [Sphingopyxis sp. BSN-002]UKK82822.1 hypothetical protein L7H23_09565 [Sphingopyxis sp. BSN-002]
MPIPEGYCLPDGNDKALFDVTASGDKYNITPLALIRCDRRHHPEGIGADYLVVKAPLGMLDAEISRPEFLKLVEPEMGKAKWQDGESGKLLGDVSKNMTEATGSEIAITGTLAPQGVDADCAYIGGKLNVEVTTRSMVILGGICMTAVGGKIMTVNAYNIDGTPGGFVRQMRRAHDLAMQIRPAP